MIFPILNMQKRSQGFSLIEAMVALSLLAIIMAAAYYNLIGSTRQGARSVQSLREGFDVSKLIQQIEKELQNIVPLRAEASPLSSPTHSTSLGNLDPTETQMIPSSVAPFPGYSMASFTSSPTLAPINPAGISVQDDDPSDALRFVYFSPEHSPIPLARTSTNDAFPTNQIDDPDRPILLESQTETSPLQAGDFALISDDEKSDLIRITGIGEKTSASTPYDHWQIEIEHDPSVSVWNRPLQVDYGAGSGRAAYLQKVFIVTYAHDQSQSMMMRDSHVRDDGFDPTLLHFSGPPGLAHDFRPVLQKVSQFHVEYLLKSGTSTRAPAAGISGAKANPDTSFRGNELGNPELSKIVLILKYLDSEGGGQETLVSHKVGVENLTGSGSGGGDGEGGDSLDGPLLSLGAPTPTPGPSPAPPPAGTTSTGGSTLGGDIGPPSGGGGGF